MEPVKKAHPGASYADIFTLAGVVAIKEANGPIVGWSSGRVDEPVSSVGPDGRLPNAEAWSATAAALGEGDFAAAEAALAEAGEHPGVQSASAVKAILQDDGEDARGARNAAGTYA